MLAKAVAKVRWGWATRAMNGRGEHAERRMLQYEYEASACTLSRRLGAFHFQSEGAPKLTLRL